MPGGDIGGAESVGGAEGGGEGAATSNAPRQRVQPQRPTQHHDALSRADVRSRSKIQRLDVYHRATVRRVTSTGRTKWRSARSRSAVKEVTACARLGGHRSRQG